MDEAVQQLQQTQTIISSLKEAVIELEKAFGEMGIKDLSEFIVKLTNNTVINQLFGKQKNVDKMGAETTAAPDNLQVSVLLEKEPLTYFIEKISNAFHGAVNRFDSIFTNQINNLIRETQKKISPVEEKENTFLQNIISVLEKTQLQSKENLSALEKTILSIVENAKRKEFIEQSSFKKPQDKKTGSEGEMLGKKLDDLLESNRSIFAQFAKIYNASKTKGGLLSLLYEIFLGAGIVAIAMWTIPGVRDFVKNTIDWIQHYILAPIQALNIIIGKNAKPFLSTMTKGLFEGAQKLIKGTSQTMDKVIDVAKGSVSVMDDAAKGALDVAKVADVAGDTVATTAKSTGILGKIIGGAFDFIKGSMKGLLGGFVKMAGAGLKGIVGFVGKILGPVGSFFHAVEMFDYFKQGDVFNGLLSLVAAVGSILPGGGVVSLIVTGLQLTKISDAIGNLTGGGDDGKTSLGEAAAKGGMMALLSAAPRLFTSVAGFLMKNLPKMFSGIIGKLFGFLKFIFNKIPFVGSIFYIADAIEYFKQGKIPQAILAIFGAVTSGLPVVGTLLSFLIPFVQALFDNKDPVNVPQTDQKLNAADAERAKNMAQQGAEIEKMKKQTELKISADSVQKTADEANINVGRIASGALNETRKKEEELKKIAEGTTKGFQDAINKIKELQAKASQTIINFYNEIVKYNKNLINKVFQLIKDHFTEINKQFSQISQISLPEIKINLDQKLFESIKTQYQQIINNFTNDFINKLQNLSSSIIISAPSDSISLEITRINEKFQKTVSLIQEKILKEVTEDILTKVFTLSINNKNNTIINVEKISLQQMISDVNEIKNFLKNDLYSLGSRMINVLNENKLQMTTLPNQNFNTFANNFKYYKNDPIYSNIENNNNITPGSLTPYNFRYRV